MESSRPLKHLLTQLKRGSDAPPVPIERVYEQLRQLAEIYMRQERPGHPLQATELVHEAYCEMVKQRNVEWENRAHFFWIAAKLMRRILCDHARKQKAIKYGGDLHRTPLDELPMLAEAKSDELVALDEALDRLADRDPLLAKIVEMRFFFGATEEEIAGLLDISVRTVKRHWNKARVWLRGQLGRQV
jgi:RNA polymerase sigma factor (TIGR02999 family)